MLRRNFTLLPKIQQIIKSIYNRFAMTNCDSEIIKQNRNFFDSEKKIVFISKHV